MKILHVVPTYLPACRYGDPIVALHGLCKALVARGHEVDVMTTNVDGDGTVDAPVGVPVDVDGVRVRYYASTLPRLYWSPDMRRALHADVRKYDLVHIAVAECLTDESVRATVRVPWKRRAGLTFVDPDSPSIAVASVGRLVVGTTPFAIRILERS